MPEHRCHIENGVIVNRKEVSDIFKGLKDGIYVIKFHTRKNRTMNQNSYYWGVVCDMVLEGLRDAGYREVSTPQDAHEVMKGLFLVPDSNSDGDITTTNLTTIEFNEYIEKIQLWAAEYLSISIPSPHE